MRYIPLILISLLLSSIAFVTDASEQMYEKFAHQNIMQNVTISPDGEQIAAIYNTKDGPQVVLMDFPTIEFTPLVQLKKARDRIEYIRWSGNKFLLVSLSYPEYFNGKIFRVNRIYSINTRNNKIKELVNKRFIKQQNYKYQSYNLVSSLKNDPEYVLLSTYDFFDKGQSVFKVNLTDSKFEKILVNREEIDSWYADSKGNVRLGVQHEKKRSTNKHEFTIWYREADNGIMKKLHTRVSGEGETFGVLALTPDSSKAYVLSDRVSGRESLWEYNITSGKFDKLVFSHEKYDTNNGLFNNEGDLIGVTYFDDFKKNHYFNQQDSKLTAVVSGILPNTEFNIVSRSKDKKRMIVWAQAEERVPIYYYVDLRHQKAGAWLATIPQLVKTRMAKTQNIEFPATDGTIIPGYLTMPLAAKNPPLIVMPHGGPSARDYKYFDPILQFMVNKGYAILQINFRGSTGYGSSFKSSGYFGWGKLMQQDVYDGMDYALENFPVSKDKSCMVGFSYGGYVALTSAFQQPNRFDCIASISGISDLKDLVRDEDNWGIDVNIIVDTNDSKAMDALDNISAINHINKIKSPILLIHGTKDTQVHHNQSADFYDKAEDKIDIDYVEIKNGTHYFDDAESRLILFKELDKFLGKHL